MPKTPRINKEAAKRFAGKCYFCPCNIYELLDVHRIVEGAAGGKYTDFNTVVVCAACHRKIHAGLIRIDRKYYSTNARWVLHYFDEQGVEHYD